MQSQMFSSSNHKNTTRGFKNKDSLLNLRELKQAINNGGSAERKWNRLETLNIKESVKNALHQHRKS